MTSPITSGIAASCSQPWCAGLQHLRRELEPVHHRLGQTGGDGTLQVAGVVDLQGLHVGAQQGGQLSQGGVLHCRGRLGHQGRSSLGLQADGLQGFGDRVGGHGLYCRRYCMSPADYTLLRKAAAIIAALW
jgi:hypothetical protein